MHSLAVEQEHLQLYNDALSSYREALAVATKHPVELAHQVIIRLLHTAQQAEARTSNPQPPQLRQPKEWPLQRRPPNLDILRRNEESLKRHVLRRAWVRDPNYTKPLATPHSSREPHLHVPKNPSLLERLDTRNARRPRVGVEISPSCSPRTRRARWRSREWDVDGSGDISFDEFSRALHSFGLAPEMASPQIGQLFREFNANGSGEICFDEFDAHLGKLAVADARRLSQKDMFGPVQSARADATAHPVSARANTLRPQPGQALQTAPPSRPSSGLGPPRQRPALRARPRLDPPDASVLLERSAEIAPELRPGMAGEIQMAAAMPHTALSYRTPPTFQAEGGS